MKNSVARCLKNHNKKLIRFFVQYFCWFYFKFYLNSIDFTSNFQTFQTREITAVKNDNSKKHTF